VSAGKQTSEGVQTGGKLGGKQAGVFWFFICGRFTCGRLFKTLAYPSEGKPNYFAFI
jgi:hypothetical protein